MATRTLTDSPYRESVPPPPDWTNRAACAGRYPTFDAIRDGEYPGSDQRRQRLAEAASVCHSCPVLRECARFADELPANLRQGVWAGRLGQVTSGERSSKPSARRMWRTIDPATGELS